MKKLITISLLALFLVANTEIHQLLRMPVLIHHFWEHSDQDHNETLADFINDHYNGHLNHPDTGHHDHDNLPFKTTDCATTHISTVFVNYIHYSVPGSNAFQNNNSPVYNGIVYSSAFTGNIWQPPKIS